MNRARFFAVSAVLLVAAAAGLVADDAASKKKDAVKDIEVGANWVYDDLPAGIQLARAQNKPLLVVFR